MKKQLIKVQEEHGTADLQLNHGTAMTRKARHGRFKIFHHGTAVPASSIKIKMNTG
jgi:hypothetical protein